MSAIRLSGLFGLALFVAVAAVSAQPGLPPGVKLPPVVKPGGNPGGVPGGVPPGGPKVPVPPVPPGKDPGVPGVPGVGTPGVPGVPGGAAGQPAPKKDDIKWPKEVGGKTIDMVAKEMRPPHDPAAREAAVRMLPMFGPKGREAAVDELLDAMTAAKEPDMNVRLAAVSVAPTVLVGYAKAPDPALTKGLNTIAGLLTSGQPVNVKFEAVGAVGNVGPYMRTVRPDIIQSLTTAAKDGSSWQLRRVAVMAIGSVGHGTQTGENPEDKSPPDPAAVTALLEVLRADNCAAVRLAAVNALIGLGPVAATQQKAWRTALDNVFKVGTEKDKSVLLWVHVLILRNDPNGVKGNELHLTAVGDVLRAKEPAGRAEACQALAVLGEEAVAKLGALHDIINDEKEEPVVVAAAIMAAAAMPTKAGITLPVLQKVKATHKNEDVRKIAGEAIDHLNGIKKKN